MQKMKYVRLEQYDSFIFFPEVINHSTFKDLKPISAGFCFIGDTGVKCFGESFSLMLPSKQEDTKLATLQLFGPFSKAYLDLL